jgi:hypothetical protein
MKNRTRFSGSPSASCSARRYGSCNRTDRTSRRAGSLTASLNTPANAAPTPGSPIFAAAQRIAVARTSYLLAPSSGAGPNASTRQSAINAPFDGHRR